MYSSSGQPVAKRWHIMTEWPHRWMLQLPETIEWDGDTACSCNCHYLCLRSCSVARCGSGFVIIVRASWLGKGAGRVSRPLGGVGVLPMLDVGLDTTRHVESVCEVSLGAAVLRLLLLGMVVGVYINRRCGADGVEVTRWVMSAMRELFREDEGVQFGPRIVDSTELTPWEESILPADTKTRPFVGGSWEFPEGPCLCSLPLFARHQPFCTTGVMSGCVLSEVRVQPRCSTLRL